MKSASDDNQMLITSYFKVEFLKRLEDVISDNNTIFDLISPALSSIETPIFEKSQPKEVNTLLQALLNASIQNENKSSKGRRYEDSLKRFSCVLYLLCGRMAYEILYANLQGSLPSISTLKVLLDKESQDFKTGVLRTQRLKKWLIERHFSLRVSVSEDQTKIVESVQYNSRENNLVGLSIPLGFNGFPKENQFPAKDAHDIVQAISTGNVAAYVNVYMIQPLVLEKSPGFCLCIYPTDNRFTYQHCLRRWEFLEGIFAYEGKLNINIFMFPNILKSNNI